MNEIFIEMDNKILFQLLRDMNCLAHNADGEWMNEENIWKKQTSPTTKLNGTVNQSSKKQIGSNPEQE